MSFFGYIKSQMKKMTFIDTQKKSVYIDNANNKVSKKIAIVENDPILFHR